MIKRYAFGVLTVLLSLLTPASALAVSYNGTNIAPAGDGKTYAVTANNGDTVNLTNVGGTGGKLTITFNSNVTGSIVVNQSSTRPSGASSDAPGTVSLYFDVTLSGFTNSAVGSAKWQFTVTKAWLTEKGVTADNVFLHHFNGSTWERLTTRQISSTETTVTLEADVTSFSPFAVTAVAGLSNTGSPYLIGAVIASISLAVIGGSFYLSRKQRA